MSKQFFDRSKTRHDWAKIGLASQHDWRPFKNYFEPWLQQFTNECTFSFLAFILQMQIIVDYLVGIWDELHESFAGQSLMFCFDNASQESFCCIIDLDCFLLLCL